MRRIFALTTALSLAPLGVASAAPPEPASTVEAGMVRFHLELEGKRRTTPALFQLVDYDREGLMVCEMPCDVPVSTRERYQVRDRAEHTLIGSKPFLLDPNAHEITATVRGGRRKMFSAGLALAMIGPVLVISGALLLGLGAAEGGPDSKPETIAGAATLGAGVGMLIIGLPMIFAGRNRVKLRRGAPR
jgi:hypothetical protein